MPRSAHVRDCALPPRVAVVPTQADIVRHLERARRAFDFHRMGRHAAAERLLRDVAGKLRRRAAFVAGATTLVSLGRILLERGRATAAEATFDEAGRVAELPDCGELVHGSTCPLDARLWQAAARTDALRLADAESLCRTVLRAPSLLPARRAWAEATLARVLLWQGRSDEAQAICPRSCQRELIDLDPMLAAVVEATAVRVTLLAGDVFLAGQGAHALVTATAATADPISRIVAWTAHLRVLAAVGDLDATQQRLHEIVECARCAHTPLRAARARVIWHDALRRAGRTREAKRELERLVRLARAGPALLRQAVEHRVARRGAEASCRAVYPVHAPPAKKTSSSAAAMLRLVQGEDSDRLALLGLMGHVGRELGLSRIDLVAGNARGAEPLMTFGCGCAPSLGGRVMEAGVVVSGTADGGGREVGVPIRTGTHLLGALVARWRADRQPSAHVAGMLDLAAAIAAPRLEAWLVGQQETWRSSTSVPGMLGASAAMASVRRAIERAAKAPFAVLIEGESGVGKELAARAVHQLSGRHEQRFCDMNCAALPDDLLDSELFGHSRGAFTGAVADRAGLFEDADNGTLFLDEVADLSPRGQAKLLRVIQQQEVRRLGETFSRKVDVRLVTAANRDMRAAVAAGGFRADLLYRLDVIRIRIPPLRERPEDIAVLAQHFWRASAARMSCGARLTRAVVSELASYHWPGNVRQLQNVMAALAVSAPTRGELRRSMLPADITGSTGVAAAGLADARSLFERRYVEAALSRAGGSRTRAAADLGLSRQGLSKAMARLSLG